MRRPSSGGDNTSLSWASFQILGFEWVAFIFLFIVLAVVLFILVGIWLYRDAHSRGMDGTLWFVILLLASIFGSFIGGIIVLFVYLVVREGHPVGGPRYPYGYPPVPAYAYPPYGYPPYAGQPYGPAPPAAPSTAPPTTAPAAPAPAGRCTRCGTAAQPGARFCASCGSPL